MSTALKRRTQKMSLQMSRRKTGNRKKQIRQIRQKRQKRQKRKPRKQRNGMRRTKFCGTPHLPSTEPNSKWYVSLQCTCMRVWVVGSSVCSGAERGPLFTDMHAPMTLQGEPDKIAHSVYDNIDTFRNNMQDMLGKASNPIFDESRRSCCLHAQYRFIYY